MKYLIIFNESTTAKAGDSKLVYEYLKSFKHWAMLNDSAYVIISDLKPSTIRNNILTLTNHYGEVYVLQFSDKYSVFAADYVTEIFELV